MGCGDAGCFVDVAAYTDCELRFWNRRFSAEGLATRGFIDLTLLAIMGACITFFLRASSTFKTTHILK
jgi:hypothetical protein